MISAPLQVASKGLAVTEQYRKFFRRYRLPWPQNCPTQIIQQLIQSFQVDGALSQNHLQIYRATAAYWLYAPIYVTEQARLPCAERLGKVRWIKPIPEVGLYCYTASGTLSQHYRRRLKYKNQSSWQKIVEAPFRFSVVLTNGTAVTLSANQLKRLPGPLPIIPT